jgi:hypothetical protein
VSEDESVSYGLTAEPATIGNNLESLWVHSPRLAAKPSFRESRDPEIKTGYRIKSGMTNNTPLLAAG